MVDLQRRVIDLEAFREQTFELAPDRVAVVAGTDKDVRRERWEAGRDRPHVQVVHVGHARVLGCALPISVTLIPSGAASRSTRPESRKRPYAARIMIAATIKDAIGSARMKPVVRMTTAAMAVKMNARTSVRMCWKLPSTFMLSRFAFASC